MRLKTANARRRRNFWKRKGCAHIRFNQGIWLRQEIVDPENISLGMAQQVLGGGEQPHAYVYYP